MSRSKACRKDIYDFLIAHNFAMTKMIQTELSNLLKAYVSVQTSVYKEEHQALLTAHTRLKEGRRKNVKKPKTTTQPLPNLAKDKKAPLRIGNPAFAQSTIYPKP